MKWFGDKPWAPVCEPEDKVEVPVGFACLHCDETIKADDRGFVAPYLDGSHWFPRPEHLECFTRGIIGGPEHVLGRCNCHAQPLDDKTEIPPDMTLREEALWVWNWASKRGVH